MQPIRKLHKTIFGLLRHSGTVALTIANKITPQQLPNDAYYPEGITKTSHDALKSPAMIMGIITRLSGWSLNYQVAAFGAYATILVESTHLILGGFEPVSLLSISILTNASVILVAGFGGPSATPLAILRICLTSLFLLCAIILHEDEEFDGTYPVLCSVAHLTYQLGLQYYGKDSEGYLPRHEKEAKTDGAPPESCLRVPSTDDNDTTNSSRDLCIFFGDSLCLEGSVSPITLLGTVMTYRVFDFDLGFGLVFAFMSAFLSSIILLFINSVRQRGRRIDSQKIIQRLISLMLIIGIISFVFFTTVEFPDIDFSWLRVAFGVAWFMFLFRTTYTACRFLTHATIYSCTACNQREAGINGPLNQEASAACIWDDYAALPALNHDKDDTNGSTTLRISRHKGLDLIERFWLNDQEWCQISPRSFVIFFVSCLALASFSGGALNPDGMFASIGSHVSKNIAFYVTMIFTFASTGHTPVGDSPELMFVSLRHSFPEWKATAGAIIMTIMVQSYILFVAPAGSVLGFVVPLVCTVMAPLLLAGVSKRLDPIDRQGKCEPSTEEQQVGLGSDEPVLSSAKISKIDSTLVYSSSRIRGFDLRVLLLGLSITFFDILYNKYQDDVFLAGWPTSAVIPVSVTVMWLYLENTIPRPRDLEPWILSLAVTALVGNFSPVNFQDVFGLGDNKRGNEVSKQTIPLLEKAKRSEHILSALWYTTLFSMVVVNRRLVHRNARDKIPTATGQFPKKDHLLFGFQIKTSRIHFEWQLRNSRVVISHVFAMLASCLGESWPLGMDTTVADLFIFTLVVGFQLQPTYDSTVEEKGLDHVVALGFSALTATLAVGLNRHDVLHAFVSDPKGDWKAGTWSALVSYQLFLAISQRSAGRSWFRRLNHVAEPLGECLRVEDKAAAQEREKQNALYATTDD